MKEFNYTPEELNLAVYQVQKTEQDYQSAKDDYEILYDTAKDLLAALKTKFSDNSDAGAETEARATDEWRNFKQGLYAAQRKLGLASIIYNHSRRVLDALVSGLAYKRELLKKNIIDQ